MNVMKKAWEIARKGAAKFGGSVKSYFAQSLKMAWAMVKEVVSTDSLKTQLFGLLEQSKRTKETYAMLKDNYEMALMHGQKAKADAQLASVKADFDAIAAKIQEIRNTVGQDTMVEWVKAEAAARKAEKEVA